MDISDHKQPDARKPPQGSAIDRRTLLKIMGASLALAGMVGCKGQEDEAALPYVVQPEDVMPGIAKWYATAVTMSGYAQPIVGKTFTGRPVKLEGNPDHPASGGKSDAFTQAALLSLYDPNRSRSPRRNGTLSTWSAFEGAMAENALRLDAQKGEGLCLLLGPTTSLTMSRQLDALAQRWPKSLLLSIDPSRSEGRSMALRGLFGRQMLCQPRFDRAEVVVCLDDDFLGPGPYQTRNSVLFGRRRQTRQTGGGRSLLFVAEPVPTATGAIADRCLSAEPHNIEALLNALASALGLEADIENHLNEAARNWVELVVQALLSSKGLSVVTVGEYQSERQHRLAVLINERLGNLGATVAYIEDPASLSGNPQQTWRTLGDRLRRGKIDTLVCLGSNPVYTAPGQLELADLVQKVPLVVHAGLHLDETAQRAHWHVPLQHDLETWSDAVAVDGSASILQPLVRPFFDVRSRHVIVDLLNGGRSGERALVEETWRTRWGNDFDARWRHALVKGFVEDTRPRPGLPAILDRSLPAAGSRGQGLTVLVRPDPGVWDGTFSENAWMQETPRPLSKIVWDNVIQISPDLARSKEIQAGDEVGLSIGGGSLTGAAWVASGQAANTISVTLGYGRKVSGGVSADAGFDVAPLRSVEAAWELQGATISKTGAQRKIATTQPDQDMDPHDFSRVVTAKQPRQNVSHPPSFYPDRPISDPAWAMAIDLDLCIGCNACITACQAENNIPVVGRDLVAEGREMHWMRVDHYLSDRPEEPSSRFQPVPCMHCEQAPCEMGCPVNAAVHSKDGLNLQVYNRCIGTRTCSSFCPYKVRRFNWFDYTAEDAESVRAMRNPDVTVRSRGVMEKCTYCVQRIEAARIAADKEGRPIREGEVITACQQACPTEAIVFGNVADPNSAVSRKKAQTRHYILLEEANTRPRTTYLARIGFDLAREEKS
ncbi:molybdopterin-containing oxidoreductase family iron-sulfur binding subunit [Rhizobium binae]|uniref:Molybdopterin-containing oxidoreductase family iron-sulfur binding subunit n=1 Tax=Rhizobium binae TaxID=1138190 RepID=A0ABV2MPS4_9HYPH|nr:4Fe-4S dicluster domain-containing protein [Rhizobium binae]MBX4970033.1 4Fe-4S dicluster domain-containing protein [Rhizobium binae]MBX4994916.1 4Fe-4S dicluster domain-containing protein [Rhizobium binae]NKL52544.1 4Fe-4S dicluster domain-containing protein [Rhizobium leguminosarum bv. viciae]QSY85003.1 4Fe-4S dicluster domain-containing protein [Rhizobium binae]